MDATPGPGGLGALFGRWDVSAGSQRRQCGTTGAATRSLGARGPEADPGDRHAVQRPADALGGNHQELSSGALSIIMVSTMKLVNAAVTYHRLPVSAVSVASARATHSGERNGGGVEQSCSSRAAEDPTTTEIARPATRWLVSAGFGRPTSSADVLAQRRMVDAQQQARARARARRPDPAGCRSRAGSPEGPARRPARRALGPLGSGQSSETRNAYTEPARMSRPPQHRCWVRRCSRPH